MAAADLTAARVREVLEYEPSTGVFTWRVMLSSRGPVGRVAGSINPKGYVVIQIDGSRFYAHRLAVLYVDGTWPTDLVDHWNRIGSDNRWDNLRRATHGQNAQNSVTARDGSRSGRRGVSWFARLGLWRATIQVGGRQRSLGYFADPADAEAAYLAARDVVHPFSRGAGLAPVRIGESVQRPVVVG